jgi:hypothetical protein
LKGVAHHLLYTDVGSPSGVGGVAQGVTLSSSDTPGLADTGLPRTGEQRLSAPFFGEELMTTIPAPDAWLRRVGSAGAFIWRHGSRARKTCS